MKYLPDFTPTKAFSESGAISWHGQATGLFSDPEKSYFLAAPSLHPTCWTEEGGIYGGKPGKDTQNP
jgi:hypothetical protein